VHYEPIIAAAPVRHSSFPQAIVAGGLLSLILWAAIIAIVLNMWR